MQTENFNEWIIFEYTYRTQRTKKNITEIDLYCGHCIPESNKRFSIWIFQKKKKEKIENLMKSKKQIYKEIVQVSTPYVI